MSNSLQLAGGVESEPLKNDNLRPQINISQLLQSRIGLLSQALMLILIVGFLFSETLSEFWKTKVPVNSRNWHDVLFRVIEIGVAFWFPAVLWNCMQPSELWILNPRKLLARYVTHLAFVRVNIIVANFVFVNVYKVFTFLKLKFKWEIWNNRKLLTCNLIIIFNKYKKKLIPKFSKPTIWNFWYKYLTILFILIKLTVLLPKCHH